MAIRLLCVSTAKNTNAILKQIMKKMEGDVEFLLHLGDVHADIKASSMTRMNNRSAKGKQHIMTDQKYTGLFHSIMHQEEFEKDASEFIDHLHRLDDKFRYKSHNLSSLQDYMDYYHILFDVLSSKIVVNKITHMLFFNVPHLGYDTMCYHIAKSLGIKTTIVTQSLFPDRFFSMHSVDDYGQVEAMGIDFESIPIEKEKKMELFYMKNIKQGENKKGHISLKALLQIMTFLMMKKPIYFLNFLKLYKILQRTVFVYGKLPEWRDPFARYFHENELEYFEHILQYEETPYDMTEPYVYFAMQMQPEMTTSALGGWFKDQALAIESLASMLPDNVKIYVKENPKQGAYMRGPLFFHRLKRIPSVSILPSHANTHDLTANALFAATITGTVGWEAVRKGQKVLIFGNTWYQSFPGVFKYNEELTFEAITEYKIIHSELENALGLLMTKSHEGVVDRHYTKIVPNFNKEANLEKSSNTIISLIKEEINTTFS